ncbi:MAG TPA: LLM class flavin-dependent oxidoreductase [Methylophaga sp.]|jgi:luciferase-type oxidoreductase|uniref:LLM class oxidoreductase n=1 Tax=unclassified Methylophaga TaxID=2629249 RepID=UPI000C902559|nr:MULTISPECIES: LLM class oxidoreductase [unclassified Methylophaga]MAP26029.1 LLM class flavin-dependent oxidoreductase [Methylophaga sp.]HAD30522.1 LLM class flavin-dependent oxidoreductase [Methylophaga sp.]HCN99698.1 LLM class flavin-dependent oxidoreductase [Methylophaga sp.]|tara:strand:+ start:2134 stop:3066 length:933 start_codon:yes stop_codon:yes gene_type:complete
MKNEPTNANSIFTEGKLSLGLMFPLESYQGDVPTMANQESLACLAEEAGFSALWFRDVPLRDPLFGDVGQIYDPLVYMSWIAAHTKRIKLATGSLILPLRHPVHLAKSLASLNILSNGRIVAGVASGDRPIEFPAFGVDLESRGQLFREHFETLKTLLYDTLPRYNNSYGVLDGRADSLPKAKEVIPLFVTGHSQQSLDWVAKNADGWITYPRPLAIHDRIVKEWYRILDENNQPFKPFAQSLYIDLVADPKTLPTPIHLGIRTGIKALLNYLLHLKGAGVNHVTINLKYGKRPAKEVIQELGEYIVPSI